MSNNDDFRLDMLQDFCTGTPNKMVLFYFDKGIENRGKGIENRYIGRVILERPSELPKNYNELCSLVKEKYLEELKDRKNDTLCEPNPLKVKNKIKELDKEKAAIEAANKLEITEVSDYTPN